ncbi:MAG TPA: hypothetical protein VIF15_05620 [Polyangiaceae bacterium]|jgi:hypothetical protein
MRARRFVAPALACAVASALSCGPSAPTLAPVATVAPPPAPVASAPPEPAPELSAIPAPGTLLFTARIAHPGRAIQTLAPLVAQIPLLASFAAFDADTIVSLALGAPLAPILDLEQPIDVAVADAPGHDGGMLVAASAQLAEGPQVRETLEKHFRVFPGPRGVVRLEPRGDKDDDDDAQRPCTVAPAYGGGSRLVCGTNAKSVSALAPYLVRTMTRTVSTADLRVEVMTRAAHLDEHDDAPATDDPDDALWHVLTSKLGDDVAKVVVEASVTPSALDLTLSSHFVSAGSPLTRALLGQATPAGPPPPAFERLPVDATAVWYARGAAPADLAPLHAAVLADMRASLADDGYAPSAIDEIVGLIDRMVLTGGPWVVAGGHRLDAARSALDAYAAGGKTTLAARAKARAALQGWMVAGVDEPPQKWMDGMRALVKTDALRPVDKPKKKDKLEKEQWRLALAPVAPGLALPSGTLHVEARETVNPAWVASQRKGRATYLEPLIPHTVHLFVVPDGARTWLAAAEDPALAASEVRASLAGAPDAGTLSARRDLDVLRAGPTSAGGALSVADLAMWKSDDTSDADLRAVKRTLEALATLTADGKTPVPVVLVASPAGGGVAAGGDLSLHLQLPLRVVTEVAKAPPGLF